MNKLELNWIGKYDKENQITPEPRLLFENREYSYAAEKSGQLSIKNGIKPTDGNLLIHGDNLLALKALEREYAGKIKCIYIDPPYNTGSAFEQYNDNLEHSTWLNLMRPRLELLRELLAKDGSIWISIDDDEGHYLKVLCDEVFGRMNFINTVIWQKKFSPQNDAKWLSDSHDFILVYARNKEIWRSNLLPRTDEMNSRYKNPDNDPRGVWTSGDVSVKTYNANTDYPITTPSGRIVNPPAGYCWRFSKEKLEELINDNRIWFGANGDNVPRIKRFISDVKDGITAMTLWTHPEVGHNQDARKEVVAFNFESVSPTPKPERLIERILTLATNENDLVLDSFLGSGTTAAVAHKMGRRWIGIELGGHAYTHCHPRLKAVIDGEQGGISKVVNWQGGGSFKFLELAPTLLVKDDNDRYIISDEYNAVALAAAMAMHKGFTYAPDENTYWKQGKLGEHNYIFTTTNYIYGEYLDKLNSEMDEDETLLICCQAYGKECNKRYKHIRVQKVPDILFGRCEFGKDNYDLNVILQDVEDDDNEDD